MLPLPGSPVIDKGGPYYNFDQRRYSRPYDSAIPNTGNGGDIGSVEVQPTTLLVVNNTTAARAPCARRFWTTTAWAVATPLSFPIP
jgi:hypothetical protein